MDSPRTRTRPSDGSELSPAFKKIKTTHTESPGIDSDVLFPEVLSQKNSRDLQQAYVQSAPFKHAVIPSLFDENLLQNVQREILEELSFTEKETDIYKVGLLLALDPFQNPPYANLGDS